MKRLVVAAVLTAACVVGMARSAWAELAPSGTSRCVDGTVVVDTVWSNPFDFDATVTVAGQTFEVDGHSTVTVTVPFAATLPFSVDFDVDGGYHQTGTLTVVAPAGGCATTTTTAGPCQERVNGPSCPTTTTSPPTTTTAAPSTTTTVVAPPPATTVPGLEPEVGPETLAFTGSSDRDLLLIVGGAFLGVGFVLAYSVHRTNRARRHGR